MEPGSTAWWISHYGPLVVVVVVLYRDNAALRKQIEEDRKVDTKIKMLLSQRLKDLTDAVRALAP